MRKFLTILSFCFLFTILYKTDVFAKSLSFGTTASFYGTEYQIQAWLPDSVGEVVTVCQLSSTDYPQVIYICYLEDVDGGTYNLRGNWTPMSWGYMYQGSVISPFYSSMTFVDGYDIFKSKPICDLYIHDSIDNHRQELLDLLDYKINPPIIEPEDSSLLDFSDVRVEITSPRPVPSSKLVRYWNEVWNRVGYILGLTDQKNYYLSPSMNIFWTKPPSNINGERVFVEVSARGYFVVNGSTTNAYQVVLNPYSSSNFISSGFDFYNSEFDDVFTDALLDLVSLDDIKNFNISNKLQVIYLQAYCDIDGVFSRGAVTSIDFTSGSPVVRYGVTVDSPEGSYSVDNNTDYYNYVSGDTIFQTTENNQTYIYNYITNNNYPASSVTSSNVVDGLGIVNTMLRNVPGMLQSALSGNEEPSSGVKLVISFLTVALGVSLALRFFGIFFK